MDKNGAPRRIELRVQRVGQLFHTLDPLPFRDRDLDQQVEEYVVGWARELGGAGPIEIVVHLPAAEAEREAAGDVQPAVRNYFAQRAEATRLQIRDLFRIGRTSLAVGLSTLAACLVLAPLAGRHVPGYAGGFLSEGLVILGWVANWRPIEIFLYDWWPLLRRKRLYQRLARSAVILHPISPDLGRETARRVSNGGRSLGHRRERGCPRSL